MKKRPLLRGRRSTATALVAGCLLHTQALPSAYAPESEESAAERASLIAVVHILEAHPLASGNSPCGTTYKADVARTEKGLVPPGGAISFGFFGTLEKNRTYKVYLSSDTSEEAWAKFIGGTEEETRKLVHECWLLHPSKAFFIRAEQVKATAPNPSIERTSPGKPGAASHVKR